MLIDAFLGRVAPGARRGGSAQNQRGAVQVYAAWLQLEPKLKVGEAAAERIHKIVTRRCLFWLDMGAAAVSFAACRHARLSAFSSALVPSWSDDLYTPSLPMRRALLRHIGSQPQRRPRIETWRCGSCGALFLRHQPIAAHRDSRHWIICQTRKQGGKSYLSPPALTVSPINLPACSPVRKCSVSR